MRNFLLRLIFISTSILVALIIADLLISKHIREVQKYPLKLYTSILDRDIDTTYDIVILGSSRALCHYWPDILDTELGGGTHTLNMGLSSCNYHSANLIYELYCKKIASHYQKPKIIIIEADIILYEPIAKTDVMMLYPYLHIDKDIRKFLRSDHKTDLAYRYIPYFRYHPYPFSHSVMQKWLSVQPDSSFYDAFHSMDDTLYKTNTVKPFYYDYSLDSCTIEMVKSFIQNRLAEDISVVLVQSPYYYKYWERLNDSAMLQQANLRLAKELNINYLDYSNSPIGHNDSCWLDYAHLNLFGAARFSKLLAHDLNRLGLSNKTTDKIKQ